MSPRHQRNMAWAEQRLDVISEKPPTYEPRHERCGLCGRAAQGSARLAAQGGEPAVRLCHVEGHDCYHLWTAWKVRTVAQAHEVAGRDDRLALRLWDGR